MRQQITLAVVIHPDVYLSRKLRCLCCLLANFSNPIKDTSVLCMMPDQLGALSPPIWPISLAALSRNRKPINSSTVTGFEPTFSRSAILTCYPLRHCSRSPPLNFSTNRKSFQLFVPQQISTLHVSEPFCDSGGIFHGLRTIPGHI